jgi:hypothetical protein
MKLVQSSVVLIASALIPMVCSAQTARTVDRAASSTFIATSQKSQKPVTQARSFEQLELFIAEGDTVSVAEGSGKEFSARVAGVSATELVVLVEGQRRVFHPDDAIRIRQRRGDSLANGTWRGFGIGAGAALLAVAADDSGLANNAGWAVVAAAVYGGIGAGIGVTVDALIRKRYIIYDHGAGASTFTISPVFGPRRAGAQVALAF